MDSAVADTLPGTVLDRRYRIEAVLAHGGMSTVYLGTDLRLDRAVAIKVMSPSFADDQVFVDRFTQEAKTAARLSHVNVVAVHDQGEDNGRAFLVMELVRGRTLRDLLHEQGRLHPDLATSLMESILAALAAAHRAGLVHRDVKPENVLISDEGLLKVTDFGLARAVAPTTANHTSVVMGTVAYVAPEQVQRGATDARVDVYGAGIVLYEMLTGVPPYSGDSVISVAYRHVHEDVPPPSRLVPGLPHQLDALVQRATRREPGGRPVDAGAFLAELHDVRTDVGAPTTPVPQRSSPPPAGQRHHTRTLGDQTSAAGQPPFVVRGLPREPTTVPPLPHHVGQRSGRRRGLLALLVVLLLAGASAGTGWWFGYGRYTEVPDLRGLSRADAATTAGDANLGVAGATREVFDKEVPPGEVAGSDPESGERITRGSDVTLLISKGPPPVEVPDVTGKPRDEAVDQLEQAGFTVTAVEEFDDDAEAGTVARQSPAEGTAPDGSTVTIVVSKGPETVEVPGVTLNSLDEAREVLEDAGLEVEATGLLAQDPPDDGRVIFQDPSAGTEVPSGSTVHVTVVS